MPEAKELLSDNKKSQPNDDDKTLIHWEILHKSNGKVDTLFDAYRKNKIYARVLFHRQPEAYVSKSTLYFERKNGSFEFSEFEKKFGISVTSKMYNREKKIKSIIYKNKKFWYINREFGGRGGARIRPLKYSDLAEFGVWGSNPSSPVGKKILQVFNEKFFWFKVVAELEYTYKVPFNTIVKHNLKGANDFLRYVYKCPLPIAKIVSKERVMHHDRLWVASSNHKRLWPSQLKVLINIDKLTEDLYRNHLFGDACRMAHMLDKKVNCAWGEKRLKEEHDQWSREINLIVVECEQLRQLKVLDVYKGFANFSGYHLLQTNRDMLLEGMNQDHCVGGYVNDVDNGTCAIFHVEGFTLQVGEAHEWALDPDPEQKAKIIHKLRNMQFRGYKNSTPPKELVEKVNKTLDEFNKFKIEEYYLIK